MNSTRRTVAGFLFASTLVAGTVAAQPAPFNDIGVTMGHWHLISKDVEANKKLFLAMGGKLFMPGGNPLVMFPGVYINLVLQAEKGDGGTEGSVVNHVGFIVDNVQQRTAQWKAAGVNVLPGNNNRLDQAFVVTPDGVRMEILEDKAQGVPIRHEHVHLSVTEGEIAKAQAWYAKTFGGTPGTRNNNPVVDLPGAQIRFARADAKQAPTRGRVLDHIGFDVRDHAAVVRKIQAEGIKLDEPVRKSAAGNTITYITDPWGTRIELVERAPLGPQVTPSLQAADLLSGTWTAGDGPQARIYIFKVSGDRFTGIVCGPCDNPASVFRIEDGRIQGAGKASFFIRRNAGRRELVDASVARNALKLSARPEAEPSATPSSVSLKRVVENFELGDRPLPAAPASAATGAPNASSIQGRWVSPGRVAQQNWILNVQDGGVWGLVCGPCTPAVVAMIDGRVDGDTITFYINHIDTPPNANHEVIRRNVMTAKLPVPSSPNLMRFNWVSEQDSGRTGEIVMVGPIR